METVQKYWKYRQQTTVPPQLLDTCGSKVIAQLLANRGIIDPLEAERFLNISEDQLSSPYEFEDMPALIERVRMAIENNEHIVVYGDFDADGITGTSILLKALKFIGANVSYYVPERVHEGHGMNTPSILRLISSRQAKLLITTDCGVSNLKEITLAKSFGVDVIITDHHELPDELPPACAIINPKMLLPESKMIHLCGAGVAYKVSQALLDYFDRAKYLKELIYLAAIGTVADIVPLTLENRVITYLGLQAIINDKPAAISEIAKTAAIALDETFNSETIAFQIGPRLNAIGRLDLASTAVELLTTDDPEVIVNLAKHLNKVNIGRKDLYNQTYEEALQMLNGTDLNKQKAIVLASKDWHPGVIGLVASRLVETFYRPTFLMSVQDDKVRGSARSIEGLHLFNLLTRVKEYFTQYGGHELAAGFNLNHDNINKFKEAIIYEVNSDLENIIPRPFINIEMNLTFDDITLELIDKINKLAPFGQNNPSPYFSVSNVKILNYKTVGADNNHLKLSFKTDNGLPVDAVWWQHNALNFDASSPVNIAFSPESNTFNNKTRIQLVLQDIVPAEGLTELAEQKKNSIKWVDHRKKTDVSGFFNNYLKMNKLSVAVFAESQNAIDSVKINCPLIDRLSNEHYDQVILFEYPSDETVLKTLIKDINPEIIHLAPFRNHLSTNQAEIVKTVLKMLKYAKSNKNSEANINDMATKLATSINVISAAIDVLVVAQILLILSYKDNILKFRLQDITATDLSQFSEIEKLKEELLRVVAYRKKLSIKPMEEFSLY